MRKPGTRIPRAPKPKKFVCDAKPCEEPSKPCRKLWFKCGLSGNGKAPSFGLVLTGGGAFGAWEVGALEALFCAWREKHPTEPTPPIQLVVGTSTGALIAPFALLDSDALCYLGGWYQGVTTADIYGGFFLSNILTLQSVNDWGYPHKRCGKGEYLYFNYARVLQGYKFDVLDAMVEAGKKGKIVAASTADYSTGMSDFVLNKPPDLPEQDPYCSRFYKGLFASTVPPIIGPPVRMARHGGGKAKKTPHFDGGPYQEAPFNLLFQLSEDYKIQLSHIIVISSYPFFPGDDTKYAQKDSFPNRPTFLQIAARFDSLLSESAVSDQTRLACQALRLAENESVSREEIYRQTGISVPSNRFWKDAKGNRAVPELIAAFPCERMGFDNSKFDKKEMGEMRRRGWAQAKEIFRDQLP